MKRIVAPLLTLLFLAGVGYTFYFLWKRSQKPTTQFTTESAQTVDIVQKTVATGAIVPRQEVEIKPRVSGVIETLFVEPGKAIKRGDSIAKIQIVPDAASLQRAQAEVQSARIAADNAKRELDRNQQLFAQGVIAEATLAQVRTEYALRKQSLDAASSSLQIVREGQTRGGGKGSNVVVTSTVDGMVIDVPVKVGFSVIESNNFNPGSTIAVVADMGDMIFQGQVDESEVGKVKVGMPLRIKIGAIEDVLFDGTLEYIAPKGKVLDGAIQFEIKAAMVKKEGVFVRAGYSANADVVLAEQKQVLAIREALVQRERGKGGGGKPGGAAGAPGSGGSGAGSAAGAGAAPSPAGGPGGPGGGLGRPFVEVEIGPQRFERRDVELGLSDGIMVEVKSGVTAADKLKVPGNAGPAGGGRNPLGGQGGPRRR
jgi:HlyD family secretion protein